MVIKTFYSLSQAENPQILKLKRISEGKNQNFDQVYTGWGLLKSNTAKINPRNSSAAFESFAGASLRL